MRIQVLDSVIIGDARRKKSYASLRELGYFDADIAPANQDRAALAADQAPPAKACPHLDLESSVGKACALLELFSFRLTSLRESLSDKASSDVAVGVGTLADDAILQLKSDYNSAFAEWSELRKRSQAAA
jgi:hypothetical protein